MAEQQSKNPDECAAFWEKTSSTGNIFLTGRVHIPTLLANWKEQEGDYVRVVLFINSYKQGSHQPELRGYIDRSAERAKLSSRTEPKYDVKPKPPHPAQQRSAAPPVHDDIPRGKHAEDDVPFSDEEAPF